MNHRFKIVGTLALTLSIDAAAMSKFTQSIRATQNSYKPGLITSERRQVGPTSEQPTVLVTGSHTWHSDYDCNRIKNATSKDEAFNLQMDIALNQQRAVLAAPSSCIEPHRSVLTSGLGVEEYQAALSSSNSMLMMQTFSDSMKQQLFNFCAQRNVALSGCSQIDLTQSVASLNSVTPNVPPTVAEDPPQPFPLDENLTRLQAKNPYTDFASATQSFCSEWALPKARIFNTLVAGTPFDQASLGLVNDLYIKHKACFDMILQVNSDKLLFQSIDSVTASCNEAAKTEAGIASFQSQLDHTVVAFQTCAGFVNMLAALKATDAAGQFSELINATTLGTTLGSEQDLLPNILLPTVDTSVAQASSYMNFKTRVADVYRPSGDAQRDASFALCREQMNKTSVEGIRPTGINNRWIFNNADAPILEFYVSKGSNESAVEPYVQNIRARRGLCLGEIPRNYWLKAYDASGVYTLKPQEATRLELIPSTPLPQPVVSTASTQP